MVTGNFIKKQFQLIISLLILFIVFAAPLSCSRTLPVHIDIGIDKSVENTLIILAERKGYFLKHGLDVSLQSYSSDLNAVNGLLAGDVDVATTSEFVLVSKAFQGQEIQTMATISSNRDIFVCGRKDRGVLSPSDLAGKRIGLPLGTAAEFALGHFLYLNGMNIQDVTTINITLPETVSVLDSGDVDAVTTWQSYALEVQSLLQDNVVSWSAQVDRPLYALTISRNELIQEYPDVIVKYLRALKNAEELCLDSPADAKKTVGDYLGMDNADMDIFWEENTYLLSLEQGLILSLEDEARWMMNNNPGSRRIMPEFLDYIYTAGLQEVKPEAVNIIKDEDRP